MQEEMVSKKTGKPPGREGFLGMWLGQPYRAHSRKGDLCFRFNALGSLLINSELFCLWLCVLVSGVWQDNQACARGLEPPLRQSPTSCQLPHSPAWFSTPCSLALLSICCSPLLWVGAPAWIEAWGVWRLSTCTPCAESWGPGEEKAALRLFEQGAIYFHFALGPENYVASPACR